MGMHVLPWRICSDSLIEVSKEVLQANRRSSDFIAQVHGNKGAQPLQTPASPQLDTEMQPAHDHHCAYNVRRFCSLARNQT